MGRSVSDVDKTNVKVTDIRFGSQPNIKPENIEVGLTDSRRLSISTGTLQSPVEILRVRRLLVQLYLLR
jgi:hypothetical protein